LVAVDATPQESPVVFVALAVAIAGLALSFWSPSWFGPRWYREDSKLTQPDLDDPGTAAVWAASHRAEPMTFKVFGGRGKAAKIRELYRR
jgi:hypothetical protein